MIRLGKLTDYGVVVMAELASQRSDDARRSASYLSGKTNIPEPTIAKVLKLLANAGLVESVRGTSGGYKIIRHISDITLLELIEAVEGPVALVDYVSTVERNCSIRGTCQVRGRWDHVNDVVVEALSRVSLADLTSTPCEGAQRTFMTCQAIQNLPDAPDTQVSKKKNKDNERDGRHR